MSEKIVLVFSKDGSFTIQDEPGMNAEKRLKQILGDIGEITRKGHKTGHSNEVGVKIGNS